MWSPLMAYSGARHNQRHNVKAGWNPAADVEWQYRKTLTEIERAVFDNLHWLERLRCANKWKRELT